MLQNMNAYVLSEELAWDRDDPLTSALHPILHLSQPRRRLLLRPPPLLRLVQQNAGFPPLGFGARAVSKPRLASVLQITMIDRRAAVTPIQNQPPCCQHTTFSPASLPQNNSNNTYATEQQLTAVVFPGHRYPFLPTPVEPHVPSTEMDTPGLGA